MDEIDLAILRELAQDGRLAMTELAERVQLSRAQTYRRVNALKDADILRGFAADVDPDQAGFPVSAVVLVQAHQGRWRELHEEVESMPTVQYAGATTGDVDLVMLVRARSVKALQGVVLGRLAAMDAVRSTRTLIVLRELIRPHPILPAKE